MSLARAEAIGRKRRRMGALWPMPIRETELGHIYAEITVRPLAGSTKSWKGQALVDTGATDTFLPGQCPSQAGHPTQRQAVLRTRRWHRARFADWVWSDRSP